MKFYILVFLIGAAMTICGFVYSVPDMPGAGIGVMVGEALAFIGYALPLRRAAARRG